ncbi:hypothetical protein MVEN_02201100 [Mycena venus]|uniref:Uncharacterized protein n=1 Tax=Mycena venus TaxID=2733690 RepID=A0A8H6X7L8_9AGAR|nr:hypothetical protein MVEN_02201100 [Mycena venus]
MTTPYTFRRRTIGRAASPPTWACYEQIHDDYDEDDEDDFSESASEDEDGSEEDDGGGESGSGDSVGHVEGAGGADVGDGVAHDMEMDVDAEGTGAADEPSSPSPTQGQTPAQAKGKQRAVDPPSPPSPKHRRPRSKKQKQARVYTLRPILTIQRSQGFVWNQDLFVPPYIKDRYVASTSPPSNLGSGFIPSTSVSSTNSALTDYDSVEVVEIRVQEGEFDGIIP